ncbi:replicase polyprotein [Elderberry carlavirus E]|uniref:Replicase polyprotein n=1 Tax=Elderberry carlavirus E TaxID=1569056 RepID=A0A0A7M929_9VIRU|nr:replicase polyprotein [Elderberry carlavirus E]AIZ76637.2 replicase polyprotein [Elderberry carlavirus E]
MALTYRSPMEEIVGSFEPAIQTAISSVAANAYKEMEETDFHLFHYALPAIAKERLSKAGIYLSPYSGVPHSHPVCKTLENYLLYKVLPSYIDNKFCFVGIKSFKLNVLKVRAEKNKAKIQKLDLIDSLNRYVTSADKLRYGNDFVTTSSIQSPTLKRHAGLMHVDALKTLIPECLKRRSKYLFMHDELHYWSPDDLTGFLEVIQPETLLATIVYPPELLMGASSSLHKWCYTYELKGSNLLFYPDGVRSEGYEQPAKGGYLLRTNKIELPCGLTYCVDIIHSKFAHHLVAITKGEAITNTYRSYGPFDAVSCTGLSMISRDVRNCFPVTFETVSKIYRYLRTLKKPDIQSAMAKLSQLIPDPTGPEIKFLEEFSKLVIKTGTVSTQIDAELLKVFMGKLVGCTPTNFSRLFGISKTIGLDTFIAALEPYSFTLKLQPLKSLRNFHLSLFNFGEQEGGEDLEAALEHGMYSPANWSLVRVPSPYVGLTSAARRKPHPILYCPERHTIRGLALAVHRSHYGGATVGVTEDYLIHWLCAVKKRGNMHAKALISSVLGDPAMINRIRRIICSLGAKFARKKRCALLMSTEWVASANNATKKAYTRLINEFVAAGGLRAQRWDVRELEIIEDVTPVSPLAPHESQPISSKPPPVETETQAASQFLCSCGVDLKAGILPRANLVHDHFPDQLNGRAAAWYSKDGTPYAYTGFTHESLGWPDWIDKWAEINNLDIAHYDCLLAQKYTHNSGIPLHADDEPIFDRTPILTVNAVGNANFTVIGRNCTASLHCTSGSFFTMPPGFQSTHKHKVDRCTAGRISLTFRKLKAKLATRELSPLSPEVIEGEGKTDAPNEARTSIDYELGGVDVSIIPRPILPENFTRTKTVGDGNCFWYALEHFLGVRMGRLKEKIRGRASGPQNYKERLWAQLTDGTMAEEEAISSAASVFSLKIHIFDEAQQCAFIYGNLDATASAFLYLANEHFEPAMPSNDCLIIALSSTIDRQPCDILHALEKTIEPESFLELWCNEGVDIVLLPGIFELFEINALLIADSKEIFINPDGEYKAVYQISNGHIEHMKKRKMPVHPVLNTNVGCTGVSEESVLALSSCGTTLDYAPSELRAKRLAINLHQGRTGAISSELFNDKPSLEPLVSAGNTGSRTLHIILGTFGAGKSTLFKKFMQANKGRCVTYVSPRRGLADEFAADMELHKRSKGKRLASQNWAVFTFERFLEAAQLAGPGTAIIIDEIQLFPPGYVDLVCTLLARDMHIFLVGDPCQSDYDSEKDRTAYAFELSDIEHILGSREYKYNLLSRRFANRMYANRLPCSMPANQLKIDEPYLLIEGLDLLHELPKEYQSVVLVSSFEEKKVVTSYFNNCLALTFGESTGRNFIRGTILVTEASRHTSEKRWVTALSRFSENLAFVNATGNSFDMLNVIYKGRALSDFFCAKASREFFIKTLPGTPKFTEGFHSAVGKDEGVKEAKLIGDPWLKTMIDLLQIEDVEEAEIDDEACQTEDAKTHLPQCELESVRARWVHRILAKEHREKRIGSIVSEQFTDEHSRDLGQRLTNACERFETIYPRHRANDTVTFLMAVKKRLRFSNPSKERAKLQSASIYGKFLLDQFLSKIPLRKQLEPELMARAKLDFEEKKTAKSAATIENHAGRSCRDWLADIGLIFSKSQLCTKFDNRFRSAKAAQTIVCFAHSVLCRFAPYMRYIEYKLKAVLPDRFYVHSGKKLEDLCEWVKRGEFEGLCTESDYEAFDASQDQYIVAFEVSLMRYLGLPADLINDYVYIKTHLGSKLGNFAIMRFSGEASTFLFNTMANMLFTFLRYELKGSERICFAGDDMCANSRLVVKKEHEGFLAKLKLKAKVMVTTKPTFCGWHLCADGIYKKPQLVFERMCIAKETNNLHNCIDNYAIEVGYAYRLGERAVGRMDEEELESYYNCVRVIIKNRHLLKSDIAHLFRSSDI